MLRLATLLIACLAASPAAAEFVLNNLRMTLYHEMGHAVIDQADVPLMSTEETAADGFALLLADRLHSDAEMDRIIRDVTLLGRDEAAAEIFDPWAEYMPGAQRTARAICLWYGLAPAHRGDLARALGMPPFVARTCAASARSLRRAWAPVLERLKPSEADSATLRVRGAGKALHLLAPDIDRLNRMIALPRRTPLTVEACGEDNAFYYHYDDRMVICDEMVDALMRGARARR
ncbi:DUF4344 domain-containing metallopeptidase [Jannaschia sp. S6380]|uniref:DUF4344 domain-containing metallopeptidase n=1 Tax=Jannaschia sp. S6380 TaxID=2926408 RepID=UPI001FF65302|nr:DUF4344 domain-containing metallopeptidase [Jannaschia sp. S6380]MCK0168150.1 DUF4344 domain-containing metallopeptidase [Jannaschia sp. S6380]